MKEYKVIKANPGQPSWAVGSVIQLDENEAEAHVRGGLLEAHVPPPPKATPQSPPPEKKPVESATEEEHQAPRSRRA